MSDLDYIHRQHRLQRQRGFTFYILLGLAWGLAIAAAVTAHGDVRTGTYAWDYHNAPYVGRYAGYEFVALSTRGALARGAADSVHAAGGKVLMQWQPVVAVSNGIALEGAQYPWDTALHELARRRGAILTDSTGGFVDLFPGDRWDAWVLDMRDTAFVDELAQLMTTMYRGRVNGTLFDYGCGDLGWAALPHLNPGIWPAWRQGFRRLVGAVRQAKGGWLSILQCDKWPVGFEEVADGLYLEKAGWSLNPPAKVWASATRFPNRWVLIRVEDLVASRRRLFAGMALLADARFNWSDLRGDSGAGSDFQPRDPEHFELSIGAAPGSWFTKAPGVLERVFTRGLVIVNLSPAPYVYQVSQTRSYTIQPNDALTIQTRDAAGRWIVWLTDAGR